MGELKAGGAQTESSQDEGICVCLAPTGMVPTKAMNPHTPVHPDEIVADVLKAAEMGITYVHLHARDDEGAPTQDPERYAKIISGIRQHNRDLVICVSLSGRLVTDPAQRAVPLQLSGAVKPDMGSLTLASLNFVSQASLNDPKTIEYLATEMGKKGIKPELEVFDLGMVNYAKVLIKRGILQAPFYFNVLLGNIASAQLSATEIGATTGLLPDGALWSLAGIGDSQLSATAVAIALGAGVRIGLEDSIWYDRARKRHASNLQFVSRTMALLEIHQRKPLTPAEFRKRMGLNPGQGSYGVADQR